jgi:hypothetical protein
MENRFLCLACFRHEGVEILHHAGNVDLTVCRKNDFISSQHMPFILVHL